MRKILLIGTLLLPLMLMAQDLQTISQRDIVGSARYVAMAGAMTAVGGDPTAVSDNPAGLGLYRSFETELTADLQWENKRVFFIPTMASIAFTMPSRREGLVRSHNLMFGFHRIKNFVRSAYPDPWIVGENTDYARIKEMNSRESGYMNCYDIAWAVNLNDRYYIGLSANVYNWRYEKEMEVWTRLSKSEGYYAHTFNTFTGLGLGATLGFLARPTEMLRLGASIATPTWGNHTVTDYDYDSEVTERRRHSFSLPFRTTLGMALQFKRYGLLSLEYDYSGLRGMRGVHTLKAGGEAVLARRWFLNIGYAYESTFRQPEYVLPKHSLYLQTPVQDEKGNYIYPYTDWNYRTDEDFRYMRSGHTVGAGLGYHGNFIIVHLAYQWRLQRYDLYPDDPWEYVASINDEVFHADNMQQMRAVTNRIVLTIGWKH